MFYSRTESKVALHPAYYNICPLRDAVWSADYVYSVSRFAILTACLLVFARETEMKSILRLSQLVLRLRRRTIKREIVPPDEARYSIVDKRLEKTIETLTFTLSFLNSM